MKIVIAPDSFKESLSAKEVCQCIERGFVSEFPDAEYIHLPLADGGEGTVDVLLQGMDGELRRSVVTGPLGELVEANWALLDNGKTALIEIAAASGLDLVESGRRNPAITTTYGTGELIREALDLGVDKVLLGLGGSATNDGGAGIVQALGGQLLNEDNQPVARGGLALSQLMIVDLSQIHPRCRDVEFIVACDVSNPLCGESGASHVFGPQKGADSHLVEQLDAALDKFAMIGAPYVGVNHRNSPGFGAAGGTPMGLALLFNLHIKAGIEMVLDALGADELLRGADLVITGEGQMDNQTLQGKTPYGIAKRANAKGIPIIGIAGSLGKEVEALYPKMGAVFGTVRSPQLLDQVLSEAESNLIRTARNVAATLKLGSMLVKP